jgi:hypothetical protein
MQNRPTKHRSPFKQKNHTQVAPKDHGVKRKPFSTFLIDTGFWPLAFAGRCVQQFGFGAVVGFVLGAACLYGYSFFRILPGSKAAVALVQPAPIPTPAPPKTVVLHGTVKSHETQFEIGVLAIRRGPFQPDGSYSVEVPESDRYLVIGWYPDYSKFKMQDMSPDKSGTLQELVFPTSPIAKREGPVDNQRNKASDNYALAATRKSRAKDGGINMKNALLERSK